ncbi:hypothetical protein B1R94_27800 [Mycolicibacterium litorale]|nr:hypothetical protein B1R94_27800 [Mycolicibacterium litorale]
MIWMKRLAAGAALATGPALFALGSATDSWAETGSLDGGANLTQPAHHDSFPGQHNQPTPGSVEHHHHQWNR